MGNVQKKDCSLQAASMEDVRNNLNLRKIMSQRLNDILNNPYKARYYNLAMTIKNMFNKIFNKA